MLNICNLIGHRRSKRWARPAAGTWTSECKRCGTRLERIGPGRWLAIADRRASHPPVTWKTTASAD
jgi:hypothetical protein